MELIRVYARKWIAPYYTNKDGTPLKWPSGISLLMHPNHRAHDAKKAKRKTVQNSRRNNRRSK